MKTPVTWPKIVDQTIKQEQKRILEEATKILESNECLCCRSILCANNWSPTKYISDIINEYNNIHEQIKNRS